MTAKLAHRKQGAEAYLQQEDEDLVVLEQHSIIHDHGQGPGHFVVQPEGQQLGYIALAAPLTAAAGSGEADGRMLMHQLHYNTTMLVRERGKGGQAGGRRSWGGRGGAWGRGGAGGGGRGGGKVGGTRPKSRRGFPYAGLLTPGCFSIVLLQCQLGYRRCCGCSC